MRNTIHEKPAAKAVRSRFFLTLVFVVVLPLLSSAQDYEGDLITEASAGNFFGVGSRAISMSEAVVASSNDGTALIYNPAALVRIKRLEFFGALSHEKVANESNVQYGPLLGNSKNDFSKTRLNSLILTIPVPTYRGSLVVAMGVNRTKSFDRTFTFQTEDMALSRVSAPELHKLSAGPASALEEELGGIREWSIGAAIDLSPHLSVGSTLTYYHGNENYYWDYRENVTTYEYYLGSEVRYSDEIQDSYSGVGLRVGMLFEPHPDLSLGVSADAPTRFDIDEEYIQRTLIDGIEDVVVVGTYQYDLSHPFVFSAGAAWRFKTLLLEGDIGYADWSQLEYKNDIELEGLNRQLRQYYREAVRYSLGAEFVLPRYGVVVRGGYKYDPLPYDDVPSGNQITSERQSFSLGFGMLVDKVVMLDVAYAQGGYKLFSKVDQLESEYTSKKLFFSIGYRI